MPIRPVNGQEQVNESESLLSSEGDMEMADLNSKALQHSEAVEATMRYTDEPTAAAESSISRVTTCDSEDIGLTGRGEDVEYRVYSIRWFGLTQLILLNIIVSWDVSGHTTAFLSQKLSGPWLIYILCSGFPIPPLPIPLPNSSPQPPASSTGSAQRSFSPSLPLHQPRCMFSTLGDRDLQS